MSRALVKEPIRRHRFRLHRWQDVDGMVGLFGIIEQCERCNLIRVTFPITMTVWKGSWKMLVMSGG